jgi:hypothetical protein
MKEIFGPAGPFKAGFIRSIKAKFASEIQIFSAVLNEYISSFP